MDSPTSDVSPVSARLQHIAQKIRVPSGFVLGLLYLYLAHPTVKLLIGGAVIAFFGVLMRAWASGNLRKNMSLATGGPYALTRNPLYLGSLLMGIGCALAGGNPWVALGLLLFFLVVYLPVMQAEARYLTKLFPDEYPGYAQRVPLLVPKLSALPEALRAPFDFALYLRYREYRAALGVLAVFGFLVGKLFF